MCFSKINVLFKLQLNFAKSEQVLKGLKKMTTNIQVVGFSDTDSYQDVHVCMLCENAY